MTSKGAVTPVRHVDDAERRARLGARQGLAAGMRFADVAEAARGMTVLHATEPPTIHLSLRARVDGLGVEDVERALYEERSVVKQSAMRGTLFGFTRDLLPAAWGSASARVARTLAARLAKDVMQSGVATDGEAWVAEACDVVVEALTGHEASAPELRELVPALDRTVERYPDTKWGGSFAVGPPLLWLLNAQGRVARAGNGGHWRLSKPRYTAIESWLEEVAEPLPEREGYAELVRRWLWTFGPGTEADLRWWLGGTLGAVRTALADVEAAPVSLDGTDAVGWLLPQDLQPVPDPGEWVALLPTLDPTLMGWQSRDFYLGPHREMLFDSVGNGGTTAWWNGSVVGCWVQDSDARVRVDLLADVPRRVRAALEHEAERLSQWLDGVVITTIWVSPAMRAARASG